MVLNGALPRSSVRPWWATEFRIAVTSVEPNQNHFQPTCTKSERSLAQSFGTIMCSWNIVIRQPLLTKSIIYKEQFQLKVVFVRSLGAVNVTVHFRQEHQFWARIIPVSRSGSPDALAGRCSVIRSEGRETSAYSWWSSRHPDLLLAPGSTIRPCSQRGSSPDFIHLLQSSSRRNFVTYH